MVLATLHHQLILSLSTWQGYDAALIFYGVTKVKREVLSSVTSGSISLFLSALVHLDASDAAT